MGEKLKEMRRAQHISMRELSRLSGVSRPTLSRIESGAVDSVRVGTLVAIAKVLGVSVRDFF